MKIDNVIHFWSKKGLINQYSSTFSGIKCFDFIDDACQLRYLKKIINKYFNNKFLNILDVGAGLGRFSIPLAETGHYVVALEPAKSIYKNLLKKQQIKSLNNLKCLNILFEHYKMQSALRFDIIIFSGVLYFYDDISLNKIIDKSKHLLSNSGLIFIRDFFSKKNINTKSTVCFGARCYYRPFSFWENIFSKKNMKVINRYSCNLRRPFFKKFFFLGTKIFGNNFENKIFPICKLKLVEMFSHLYRTIQIEKCFYYYLLQAIWPSIIIIRKKKYEKL